MTLYSGHLENTGSMRYADLPNVDTFCYKISKKIIFINITLDLKESTFKNWEVFQLKEGRYLFSKLKFFLEC